MRTKLCLYIKYPLLFSDINRNCNMSTNFSKTPSIEFHENPFRSFRVLTADRERSSSRVAATDRERQPHMVKLTGAFYNFALH